MSTRRIIATYAFVMFFLVIALLGTVTAAFGGTSYTEAAGRQSLYTLTAAKARGTIYDRNGTVLASSVECKNVYVNPQLIEKKQRKKAIKALVEVLGVEEDFVSDLIDQDTTFAYVKRQVDEADAEILEKKNITGIEFEPAIKRVYPNGALASQVLGIVNVDLSLIHI